MLTSQACIFSQGCPQELWDAKVNQVWDFVLRRYAGGAGSLPS